ncbi:CsbD family protein [Paraburkholderia sp. Ac-20336]|uniref:CsbD family protein n=1 Tax=Burkholderiaceae TaxID=119060 RepID=UPI00141EB7C5|nr:MULTISPECIES: CsbD family protein [Burkholderiaceae]MBN3804454.1 CsbD family protein [Paraburkholderia sp. Ac-20336]MBN3850684.1 CsbD family protein [Paraburkholderia sp. Ac-20342]NIF52905.1 CsbD family protein [Burkholderia sp. Ax-1724]NIF76382.1 CsbD family protein [Paraburkholderia sp. Cy-641]
MNRNRVEGTAKELKGSIKEAIGKITGNRVQQAEGAAEKLAGRMQAKVGEAADAMLEQLKS